MSNVTTRGLLLSPITFLYRSKAYISMHMVHFLIWRICLQGHLKMAGKRPIGPLPLQPTTTTEIMAAAPRSRSRATRSTAAPAEKKASRSSSRAPAARASPAPSTASSVNPAAVIPVKTNGRKALASIAAGPTFLEKVDLRDIMSKMLCAYVPAWITCFLIQKYNVVGTYVTPYCSKMHGEKGMVFAAVGMAHLLFHFLPIFAPALCMCCGVSSGGCKAGACQRGTTALGKIREHFGTLAAALVGAFVMQVPTSVTFTWVFTWLVFSDLYFLAMVWGCEGTSRYMHTVSSFAISFLHYSFIKLKLIK